MERNDMTDWDALRRAYVTSRKSYRQLAEETGVAYRTLCQRGKQEGWPRLREKGAAGGEYDCLTVAQQLLEGHIRRLLQEETVTTREVTELGRAIKTALETRNALKERARDERQLSVFFDHPEWAE